MAKHFKNSMALMMALVSGAMMVSPAAGQSLFQAPMPPAKPSPEENVPPADPANEGKPADGQAPAKSAPSGETPAQPQAAKAAPLQRQAMTLEQIGLFYVKPARPRDYKMHDKVEVIINESTTSKLEQKLDTKESNDLKLQLSQFPSLKALLRSATLGDGIGAAGPSVGANGSTDYKGSGSAERNDRLSARISGLVKEVKPNGLVLIEARETITSDSETKTLVLSGLLDPKDVTTQNTVQSTQLANLVIKVEHSGQVKDAATKNWLTRTLDSVFGP